MSELLKDVNESKKLKIIVTGLQAVHSQLKVNLEI
jgi:hypothetical protein